LLVVPIVYTLVDDAQSAVGRALRAVLGTNWIQVGRGRA
jgi:hypothetical protein